MSYLHCPGCDAAFDAARGIRCRRCGRFLGAAAPLADQVAECVDRLGGLLAVASVDERAALAGALAATPPCPDREVTRWTNAVSGAVASTLVPAAPARPAWDDAEVSYRALAVGFWLGVVATVRQFASERAHRRLPALRRDRW